MRGVASASTVFKDWFGKDGSVTKFFSNESAGRIPGRYGGAGSAVPPTVPAIPSAIPNSAAGAKTDKNAPETVIEKQVEGRAAPKSYEFPSGLVKDADNASLNNGAKMVIKAYAYRKQIEPNSYKDKKNQVTSEHLKELYRIHLPMPPMVTQHYRPDVGEFQGSFIGDAMYGSLGGNDGSIRSSIEASVGATTLAGAAEVLKTGVMMKIMGSGGGSSMAQYYYQLQNSGVFKQLESGIGVVINPRYESSFNGMHLRVHSFSFTLIPSNQTEQISIHNIVSALRHSLHPSLTFRDLLMNYPDLFIIEFLGADNSQTNIPYVHEAFLSDFSVDYMTARMHDDNTPAQTRISMAFTERHVLTRESDGVDTASTGHSFTNDFSA